MVGFATILRQAIGNTGVQKRVPALRSVAKSVEKEILRAARHNVQRQAAIAFGGPTDHAGAVTVVPDTSFDLQRTIFQTLGGALERYFMKTKLGNKLFWCDEAVMSIQEEFSKVPAPPPMEAPIIQFMEEECNFAMEHADGSFMDHLNFCFEYSALHFKDHSPRVLFLHSIMGVGTNFFPMEKDKIPKLRELLSDFEYLHVEAFPSVLRLLTARSMLRELSANLHRVNSLKSVSFHRVIDNESLSLDSESFWIQLNYQVMHLIDFLPVACWGVNGNDPLFQLFIELFEFLQKANKLLAKCDLTVPVAGDTTLQGQPLTLGCFITQVIPNRVAEKLAIKAIKKFSASIDHSLEFKFHWQ
eukprot:TRINITY_DN21624_c0_g1_i1.p1 TRINITY_DN21624_c0_g1~~TRINITY_DN21624_c0_g1_i1.p1  ORF type:complete len:368 (+),score=72.80 TRINITY_DN21624_c0_g1_i1:31-1104(+)